MTNTHTTQQPPTDMVLLYDGSFEGLLSAIFYSYQQRWVGITIADEASHQPMLLQDTFYVSTDSTQAQRVIDKLSVTVGSVLVRSLLKAFLTEYPERERLIADIIALALKHPNSQLLQRFADPNIMTLTQWLKHISRERHRMLAFVRFEQMADDVYVSRIEPDFDVLPLIVTHFKQRYPNQIWLIYDVKRHYGVYHTIVDTQLVYDINNALLTHPEQGYHAQELAYQRLWKTYFKHVNIPERANSKQHLKSLPKRYWKYLTEKG